MLLTVTKNNLENALQTVSPSLSSSSVMPIWGHFVFRVTPSGEGNPKVEVLGTSSRMFSSCPVVAQVDKLTEKVVFTVEAKRLKEWLSSLEEVEISIKYDKGVITVKAPMGVQKFQSLDPAKFPWWDGVLAQAVKTVTIKPERLQEVLAFARQFVSDDESKRPELCVIEARKGFVYATDQIVAVMVQFPDLAASAIRIHGKDTQGLLSFLAQTKEDVEIFEHERFMALRRSDGAVFGETRFMHGFPADMNIGHMDEDPYWWDLSKSEVEAAIPFLSSGAEWDDKQMRFRKGEGDLVTLSMLSTSKEEVTVSLTAQIGGAGGNISLPDKGFVVSYPHLKKILAKSSGDTVRLGLHPRNQSGFVRFFESRNDVLYQSVLVWLRESE